MGCRFYPGILPLDRMKCTFCLLFHLLTTLAKLIRPGGSRAVIAENLLLRQQLIIHSRARQRAPNLIIQDSAVPESPNRSIWPLDWSWIKTLSGVYSPLTTSQIPATVVRPGLQLLAMQRTACAGAPDRSTSFAANRTVRRPGS